MAESYVKYFKNITHPEGIKVDGDTIYVAIPREKLRDVARELYRRGCFFRTCAGADERSVNGHFAVYHVFGDDAQGLNIVIKVFAEPGKTSVPTIVKEVPAADWCEMEIRDLLGIEFEGRKPYRLVLPPGWPDEIKPLRKDVDYKFRPRLPLTGEKLGMAREGQNAAPIPIGPYHPTLHEPEYFELYVEGERIVDVKYRGFHVHRGIEKLAETRMSYQQVTFLAERICGICGFVHSTCYCQAVEKAAKIDVPERAHFIRSVLLEIERLHSHLLWIGVACHLLGYDAGFMHMWRIRERVMVLAELLTGSRKTYGLNIIGGVRKDLNLDKVKKILEVLSELEKEFRDFVDVIESVPQVKRRLSGTGILPRDQARKLSVVGPVARGSGLNRDVRKDLPYAAYRYVSFKVPVYTEGDNLARFLVRVEEVLESMNIIRQLLDKLPRGPVVAEKIEIPEGILGVSLVEAPRGEDVHLVITGRGKPFRWKVRAPTYQNIPALKVMLEGEALGDAPITIASIDPCFSCTDRVLVIDTASGRRSWIRLLKFREGDARCFL
ncbi:MAG: hydrogenase large subunit [Thermoprotei archaeon]|nr:MAG: hydrogenase large subunit [Thermoprotei archaeon]